MKNFILTTALLMASPVLAGETVPMPNWLVGGWAERRDDGKWAEEFWIPPRGGLMIGAARIGNGERVAVFEHSRILRMPDGKLVFIAQPFGGTAVHFPMVAAGDQMIEFVNPDHDYPQRLRYWREGTALHARTSLMDGSKAMDWVYQPVDAQPD
jgi:hypothetical protein